MRNNLFLGIDASTQSVSATIIDANSASNTVSASVNFDAELPKYETSGGSSINRENPLEVWSYPQMWVEALEILFAKLEKLVDLSRVVSISGSGQQHASVWLKEQNPFCGSGDVPRGRLGEYYGKFLSSPKAPIWLDKSTSEECLQIAKNAGGNGYVLNTTGSVMTERFTAAQIRKIFRKNPKLYFDTKRIHLNSSFICSVLAASDVPLDYGDASGTNLFDLKKKIWDELMLSSTADGLREKLPSVCPSNTVVGKIGKFFCKNYGFSPEVRVCAFTGDNPSSLVGVGASSAGTAAISLGTSDTFFFANNSFVAEENSHVFANPSGGYMNLICFRNGSLARERLISELGVNWDFFDNKSFDGYIPCADGKFILPFYSDEISPKLKSDGIRYINIDKSNPTEVVRAFIEGQLMNIKLCADKINSVPQVLILTGGASKSRSIARCAADIFSCPVYSLENTCNSAALGAALRAAECFGISPQLLRETFCKRRLICAHKPDFVGVYAQKTKQFAKLVKDNFFCG